MACRLNCGVIAVSVSGWDRAVCLINVTDVSLVCHGLCKMSETSSVILIRQTAQSQPETYYNMNDSHGSLCTK